MLIEIILVISLTSIFIISTFYLNSSIQSIKIWSIDKLASMENDVDQFDDLLSSNNISGSYFGNDSRIVRLNNFQSIKSNLIDSWGESSCYPRIEFDSTNIVLDTTGVDIGYANRSTGMEVRNSIIYLSADSSTLSLPDIYIIDNTSHSNPIILSSLNTGPGVSAIAVSGPYLYLANTSSNSQLQIVDIHDRSNPYVISQLRLPLPSASSSPSRSSSIFYKNGYVYLGTNKWDGNEFNIIDVTNPTNPILVGGYDTNTLVNDIYVNGSIAYLATSDIYQMRILDVLDKYNPSLLGTFSPSGWEVQQGNVINVFENNLILGRTVGGVNRINNHEIFIFSTSSLQYPISSRDIPTGVYGSIIRSNNIFLLTHNIGKEFQVWNNNLTTRLFESSLGLQPIAMKCDWTTLYFVTGDNRGFITLKL